MTSHKHQYCHIRADAYPDAFIGCWDCHDRWELLPTDPAELAAIMEPLGHPQQLADLYDRLRFQEGTRAWQQWLDAANLYAAQAKEDSQ